MPPLFSYLQKQFTRLPFAVTTLITALAAFGCYTSMYAFRKSFTAGLYPEPPLWGVDYKTWLVIAQVFGYMLSKFYGIRFIAEQGHRQRAARILTLIGISWMALLAFALAPAPWNIACLFLNGLPLGMIWGLVFSYLEGRRTTELLGAVMSISLVFASGFVKTAGRTLIEDWQVADRWMPFCTGLLFVLPLLLCTLLLELAPPPDQRDQQLRTVRTSMDAAARRHFLRSFLPGLLFTIITYILLTILRDLRDNFEVEIWADLGITDKHIYARTDTLIALAVLLLISLLIFVKQNLLAFTLIHWMIIGGCLLAGGSSWLLQQQLISPTCWMTITGLGIYLAYIPYNAIFFERLLATFRHTGNIGFIMYVADAAGYLGSVSVLVVRELGFVKLSWGHFFGQAVWATSLVAGLLAIGSLVYFRQKKRKHSTGF
ncbi:MAG: DUF5690 family protein [Candidatus Pseudobacter hemicellulosilyticus]|uniref:DUF5690 family protein n=1 Tax=Candidatus Pseudobacter hemicellulosilyticus TaxID=3121375 RepID=A0AAJ6BE69_9BACT|nr:MAG: DUF5690 family protein [Pseudobacter sp.]